MIETRERDVEGVEKLIALKGRASKFISLILAKLDLFNKIIWEKEREFRLALLAH
jgi:hypothetical protein